MIKMHIDHVMVCAAPNSGNKLVTSILKEAGIKSHICHSAQDVEQVSRQVDKAIVIVRSQPFWAKRLKQSRPELTNWVEKHSDTYLDLLQALGDIDPIIVTYEALVAHPEKVVEALYKYCGVELQVSIPMKIYDANAR